MSTIPTAIEKRDLIHGAKKQTPENMQAMGKILEAEGWLNDAAEFYGQAKSESELQRLRQIAVTEGNTFLFIKISNLLGEHDLTSSESLKACAEKAESLSKTRYAIKAYDRLGDSAKVEALRATIATDGDLRAEAESKVFIPDTLAEPVEE